jgi:hypothetical protein
MYTLVKDEDNNFSFECSPDFRMGDITETLEYPHICFLWDDDFDKP